MLTTAFVGYNTARSQQPHAGDLVKNKRAAFSAVDVVALGYCALASLLLALVLWKYVPEQASLLAGLGVALPLPTRIAIAASSWFVRLLPFFVLLALPLAVVAVLAALWLGTKSPRLLTALLFALGLGLTLAAVFVLVAMYLPAIELSRGVS